MCSQPTDVTTLWMGDLTPDMDEDFIHHAFTQVGENVLRIKLTKSGKNPQSNPRRRYCFVEFPDFDSSQRALQRLNGMYIPGTNKQFVLKPSSRDQGSVEGFSLYVGNLTTDVDDSALYNYFQSRYPSVYGTKVIIDNSCLSKGYGFVRFSDEQEQQRALVEMQHISGLGARLLKVGVATAKKPDSSLNYGAPGQYLSDYQAWGQYSYEGNTSGSYPTHDNEISTHHDGQQNYAEDDDDAETLEDPGLEINIGKENREFIDSSESFFAAMETSRWQPLDTIMSEILD